MADKKVRETSNLIEWKEPPAGSHGRGPSPRHKEIADVLKSKPGEWARVAAQETNDGLATAIRKSRAVAFRDGIYEARSVKNGPKDYEIFARYIGPRD